MQRIMGRDLFLPVWLLWPCAWIGTALPVLQSCHECRRKAEPWLGWAGEMDTGPQLSFERWSRDWRTFYERLFYFDGRDWELYSGKGTDVGKDEVFMGRAADRTDIFFGRKEIISSHENEIASEFSLVIGCHFPSLFNPLRRDALWHCFSWPSASKMVSFLSTWHKQESLGKRKPPADSLRLAYRKVYGVILLIAVEGPGPLWVSHPR